MIKLNSYQICPFWAFCNYKFEYPPDKICRGRDSERNTVFICELWAENYERSVENA
jgi:hypothetical protein